ncbi:MAG: hypothetical protein ACM3TN_28060 [Alphaproteobacteria bacterium]
MIGGNLTTIGLSCGICIGMALRRLNLLVKELKFETVGVIWLVIAQSSGAIVAVGTATIGIAIAVDGMIATGGGILTSRIGHIDHTGHTGDKVAVQLIS